LGALLSFHPKLASTEEKNGACCETDIYPLLGLVTIPYFVWNMTSHVMVFYLRYPAPSVTNPVPQEGNTAHLAIAAPHLIASTVSTAVRDRYPLSTPESNLSDKIPTECWQLR
jgi:hypothetical protein